MRHGTDDEGEFDTMMLAEPCDAVTGPAAAACDTSGGSGGGAGVGNGSDPAEALDPLAQLAKSTAKAAAWVARKVGDVLDGGLQSVDFTNTAFLKQYAVVFAASVFIVLLLWLGAVTKRVLRAVPLTTAITEAVGLLWMSVLVTAFSPLALYVVVQASAGLSRALGRALGVDGSVFDALAQALESGEMGGGSIILILVSLVTIVLCGAVMLLMVLRTLALYVGALLGIPIHAGMVDRDYWGHTKTWAAAMAGIIAIEPVLIVIVGMSAVVQAEGEVVTGLGVTAIALGVVVMLVTKLPGWGESVKVMRQTARGAGAVGGAALGTAGAATGVMQGIHTHGARSSGSGQNNPGSGGSSKNSSGGGVSSGIAAHGNRVNGSKSSSDDKPKKND